MRKFKYLFCMLPSLALAACNNGGGSNVKINEEEFKSALNYIVNQKEDRKFTVDGTTNAKITNPGFSPIITDRQVKLFVSGLNEKEIETTVDKTGTHSTTLLMTHKNDKNYKYNSNKQWEIFSGSDRVPSYFVGICYETYCGNYSKFTFANNVYSSTLDVKTSFEGVEIIGAKSACEMTFNTDKKLSTIKETITGKIALDPKATDKADIEVITNYKFTDYGKTEIEDFPAWSEPFSGRVTSAQWDSAIKFLYDEKSKYKFTRTADQVFDVSITKDANKVEVYDGYKYAYQNKIGDVISSIDSDGVINEVYEKDNNDEAINKYVKSLFSNIEGQFSKYTFNDSSSSYVYETEDKDLTLVMKFDKSKEKEEYFVKDYVMSIKQAEQMEPLVISYEFDKYGDVAVNVPEPSNYFVCSQLSPGFKSPFSIFEPRSYALFGADFKDITIENDIKLSFYDEDSKPTTNLTKADIFIGDELLVRGKQSTDGVITLTKDELSKLSGKCLYVFATNTDIPSASGAFALVIDLGNK